jgi:LysM repeat protein
MKKIWVLIFCLNFVFVFGQKQATHLVLKGETLYAIAKKYQITPEEIIKNNPDAVNGIKENQTLLIPTKNAFPTVITTANDTTYVVQKGETLYAISKKFGISVEAILSKNPLVKDTLSEGIQLVLPTKKNVVPSIVSNKENVNLISTVSKSKTRNLVLFLPFNINKIENDSLKTRTEHLKTNKFLNLTLDYYAGALMAIDSAKALGIPVNVKIYDVESSKYTSNVASIIAKNDFSKVDVVMGPFQNSFVETTAQLLSKYNIPVISPLSKERGMSLPNLYYAIPSEEQLKAKLFQHFKAKNGNVVAIISSKKTASKEFLSANYPWVKLAAFTDKGALDVAQFKSQLVKGKVNFVMLEIEKVGTILSVTNLLKGLQKEYNIQLAVNEVYEAFNFEEIPIQSLTALKMLYPAASKMMNTPEEFLFAAAFKKINNVAPNSVAIKGFDCTFDTILRMCQENGFADSVSKYKTAYVENSFDYSNENGANNNRGCYLLYYDSDLTIKQVK